MSINDKPTHLIERAAARLREAEKPSVETPRSDTPVVTAPTVQKAPRFVQRESRPAIREPSIRIDESALKNGGLIDWERQGNRVAEEFRIAQGNLLRQAGSVNGTTRSPAGTLVMVTSALKGEGKSFTSLNLAAGIAREGTWRVLLVDAVSGPGGLGTAFALAEAPGLLDLCRDERLELADVIVSTAVPHLDFLPLGTAGTAGDTSRARMSEVLADIARRHPDRLILIDTSPCLVSSDAHTLATIVGETVLVVAAGSTQEGDVEAAIGLLRASPIVSLLLNKVRPWNGHSFGTYGYLLAEA